MSDTSLVFNALYRDQGVSTGLTRTAMAVRGAQIAATASTVMLGAAMAGTAAHAVALGQSAIVAAGAVTLLPAAIAGAIGTAVAGKVAFGGLAEAWKQTGAAAVSGGGSSVDVAHRVEVAQRGVRDATVALADAQRDALAAQASLARAREDEAERLEDLTRSVARARLDERSATLGVEEARKRLGQARSGGNAADIKRAQLAYEESKQTLTEVKDRVADLGREQQEANTKGVEGSDAVQAALQRQEQANRQVVTATERLADAQRAVAEASKSAGGGIDKAAQALAALAPSAREVILMLRALGPAWTAAGKAGQQAAFAGVAGDFRALSTIYLPMSTVWFGRMGAAFNDAMRSTFKLAQTSRFARDVDTALNGIASTTAILATAIRPVVNGFMQFVVVGSQILPAVAQDVGSIAQRFERWAVAARESGRMQQWMTSGLATIKQFGEIAKNLAMTVVALFRAGENTGTLDALVSGSVALRAWAESAGGQQAIANTLAFLRDIFTDLAAVLPAFVNNAGMLSTTMSVFGVVINAIASNLDTFAAVLPTLITLWVAYKTVQMGVNIVTLNGSLLKVAEIVVLWRHTSALHANTAALAVGDAVQKRSLVSLAALKVAQGVQAVVTGIATAAQWAHNAAWYGFPLTWIVAAILAVIAVIVLIVMYHEEIIAAVKFAWNWVTGKLVEFGQWLAQDFGPKLLGWLKWPWTMFLAGLSFIWETVKNGALSVHYWIVDKMTALIGFFVAMPGRMRAAVANLWTGLTESFRNAINWIIGKWNNFSLTLGGGNVLGIAVPSVTLNTPNLPFLDVGGHITATGLAVVHKGETVVPAAETTAFERGGRRSDTRIIFGSDGSSFGDLILEAVREAVRKRGGDFDNIIFES